MVINYKYIIQQ
ncbi:hypothetical protein C345_07063 [Cryptococcus neoformans A2-102-5]|nr:hypothetical protein C345_07063 [Cryptococcus neoformans var. grubii A2-102-5]